jgi:MFS family permease
VSSRIIGAIAVLILCVGAMLLVLAHGILTLVAGSALVGVSGIALVALAFLLIGEGEERDRRRHPWG